MKRKLLILLVVFVFLLTGCTKYLSTSDNQKVTNPETGQSLPSNILCKPKAEELKNIYNENSDHLDVKLEDLPDCEDVTFFNTQNYSGLWVTIFVNPLAWLVINIQKLVGNYGLSVVIIGLLIRLLLFPLSAKTIKQSENMKKAQPELNRLEKKYKDKNDQESMMQKSQEMMAIYKKYNISPFGSCLVTLIQLPIFFGFLEAINRIPAIFEGDLWVFQLGTTPWFGITHGNYWYIILIILIVLTTLVSFKFSMNNTQGDNPAMGQTKYMLWFMVIFIGFASFSLPSAIAIYWVVTNGFNVVQNLIMKRKTSK